MITIEIVIKVHKQRVFWITKPASIALSQFLKSTIDIKQ